MNEGAPHATPESARQRIPRSGRHKTVMPTTASDRPRREKRAYDPKAFDKEKAPIAIAAKSADGRIVEPKPYHEAFTGPHKEKDEKKPAMIPADNAEDYEAWIGMKGDVRGPKLTNDNYRKWAKSMKINLLGRRV